MVVRTEHQQSRMLTDQSGSRAGMTITIPILKGDNSSRKKLQNFMADDLGLPPELRASVQRHQAHLAALVDSLRAAGVDEGTIEASVRQLVESYGEELAVALRAFVRGQPSV